MSSSEGRRRAAGKSATAAEPEVETGTPGGVRTGRQDADDGQDPWFEPGPKQPGYVPARPASDDAGTWTPGREHANAADHAEAGSTTTEWFLPTGRAGLFPDAVTVADEDAGAEPEYQPQAASGAPPWAGEATGPAPATPPPWETGPWPGPRSSQSRLSGAAADAAARPVGQPGGDIAANSGGNTGGNSAGNSRTGSSGQQSAGGPLSPRGIVVMGLLPLVIPGLLAGALGFRRSRPGEPGRLASVVALAASLIWAVIIVVIAVTTSGGPAAACSYPAAVHQAYARAMAELSGSARPSAQVADLSLAVSRANSAAAAAGQIPVRSALFAMAGDLEQARADVVAGGSVPHALLQHLTADGNALTGACQH